MKYYTAFKNGNYKASLGLVVKFGALHFGGPGSWVHIPGVDLQHSSAVMLWQRPIYNIEEDWQQMLAQG